MHTPFKKCTSCQSVWPSRDAFLKDPSVHLVGYQPSFTDPAKGLFLFGHKMPECYTTLAVKVDLFKDLYQGTVYTESVFGTAECEKRCIKEDDLARCNQPCANAWVREIMKIIAKKPQPALKRA